MSNQEITQMKDRKVILSTLWIFVMFNYVYADIIVMISNPAAYQNAAAKMTEGLVLGFAVLMEIAIAMVLLSRVLKYRANRWANIIAGIESTAFVSATLFGQKPSLAYAFFAAIEIVCTLFIVWYAWTWHNPETSPNKLRAIEPGENP